MKSQKCSLILCTDYSIKNIINMKNQVLGLVMIVLFLIIGTNDSFAQDREIQTKGDKATLEQQRLDKKKARHENQMLIWQKRLELTDAQVTTLETYLSEYIVSVQEVKENTSLSQEDRKIATKELRKGYDAKFRAHLTEAQQAKFDSIRGTKRQLKAKEDKRGK